ncbi:hypothetical protein ACWC98_34395 [Streptomyces goshikiensis]
MAYRLGSVALWPSTAIPAAEAASAFGKDNRVTTSNGRSFTSDSEAN